MPGFKHTIASCLLVLSYHSISAQLYEIDQGSISFVSEAPLEIIRASSNNLQGLINIETREFAFTMEVNSFEGFNNPVQQVHFNENYMESPLHPEATFTGKIIENIDLGTTGEHDVRVKGQLLIHGVKRERILRGTIRRTLNNQLSIRCAFSVLLEEHDIRVPKVVQQKIAEAISVTVQGQLIPRLQ